MKSLVKHFMCIALIVLGATGVWAQNNNTIDLSTVTSDITVNNGYTLTGTLSANKKISIAPGATVTLNNVTINGVDNGSYNWAGITCNGNATIILVGENTVKGFYSYRSGIYVPENSTLTIQGSGSLTASSNGNGAGIGSNTGSSGGNINIAGGTITATGGDRCAGIGGCGGGSCGNINITGGMVTATGGNSAPGIGGGQGSSCGSITIANTVTGIRAVKGGGSAQASYSIGEGYGGSCGTVTVNGNVSNGIMTNPYSYPSYTLDDIPTGWTVKADNQTVSVTDGVASIPVGATVVLTPPVPDKPRVKDAELLSPEEIPLTFEAKTAGSMVAFAINATAAPNGVEYSTDGSTWNTYTPSTYITLESVGDKVSFRGNNNTYATGSTSTDQYSYFSCSNDCYVYGNVMSLIDADNYPTKTELTNANNYAFCGLFRGNAAIYNHTSKVLMLPATTLASYCYYNMFRGCTSLKTAPVLPATTLVSYCYYYMFYSCTSLNSVTCFATSGINQDNSTYNWLYTGNTEGTKTFYKASSVPVASSGTDGQFWPINDYHGIPYGWTVTEQ